MIEILGIVILGVTLIVVWELHEIDVALNILIDILRHKGG